MNKILKPVLQGLVTVLPLGLTIYVIYWLLASAESLARTVLLWVLPPEYYVAGLGIATTVILLFVIGLLVNAYIVRYLLRWSDRLIASIPLVKSIYGAFQDIMRVFTLGEKQSMQTVVSLEVGKDMQLIGFVTGELSGQSLFGGDKVGVYLPMSYQIGGFTVYVERDRLRVLDIGVEDAMRVALTGGIQSHGN